MGTKLFTVNGLSALGPQMGKAHGGGVKLEQGMGKISQSQDDVLSGKETRMEDDSMAKAGVISGSHSKGGFMKHSKGSYGHAKAKPDFLDIDKDGDKKESMKAASAGSTRYGGNKGDESAKTKAKVKDIKKDARKDYM